MKDKFENIKHYCKKYSISVLKNNGRPKTDNQLSNEIYRFEVSRKIKNGFYPFLA